MVQRAEPTNIVDIPIWYQWLGTYKVPNPYQPGQDIDLRKLELVWHHEAPQQFGPPRLSCEFICKDGRVPQVAIYNPDKCVWIHIYPAGTAAARDSLSPERTRTMTPTMNETAHLEPARFPANVDQSSKNIESGWAKESSERTERLKRSLGDKRVPNHA